MAQYDGWAHSGELALLTTAEGANLPAEAVVEQFPVLVRLDKDWFDFTQARSHGEDLRFSTTGGEALAYEVEQWDAKAGMASIWVRVPAIKGNAQQMIRLHWGKADAASESRGAAVFNEANGYLSVWHMDGPVKDVTGTLEAKDEGTTPAAGMIGEGRHFAAKTGVFCGDKIANYPTGADAHSSQAWFRAEQPNTTIMSWGNEAGGRGAKVRMLLRSPTHVHIDSAFADVDAPGKLPLNEWVHVVHTYANGEGRLYINGALAGAEKPKLDIKSPARLWLGGWYGNYSFLGDLDEVRVSKTVRSADWVRLEYENQKPQQTLVGPLVQPGREFSVTPAKLTVLEGQSAAFTAQAGGARKVYWSLLRDGQETVLAVDRFHFNFEAGRVTSDQSVTLRFKAVYANEVKTREVPLLIKEDIEEPIFTLQAPAAWDGRTRIEVVPQVTNLSGLQAKGRGDLKMEWTVSGLAATRESAAGKLILTRAQKSGPMTVTATLSNGGQPVTQNVTIAVTEPQHDAWVTRIPPADEKPMDHQFYARDDRNEGTLYYIGTLEQAADSVFLTVYADGEAVKTETRQPTPEKEYAFAIKLKPGLIKYSVEFGTVVSGAAKVLQTAHDLVCGDAYIIEGQSNAVATSWGKDEFPETNEWVRTYGSTGGNAKTEGWGDAIRRAPGGRLEIGYWGYVMARSLVEKYKIPICIINGAVGGTRVDEHLRSAAKPDDPKTIYGRLLSRVQGARLTHGIRGLLWHQGEADQGSLGPTGDYDWKTYHEYFNQLSSAWKQDYPNLLHYYVFQIWPNACTDPSANDMLREVQRTLPDLYSNMRMMSTLGIVPGSSCHYVPAGYQQFSNLMSPLVEQDNYGLIPPEPITAPNLLRAFYTNAVRDEIALEFGQEMLWSHDTKRLFFLDGQPGKVVTGRATANIVTLQLVEPSQSERITYLVGKAWNQMPTNLLYGKNGIAALTFCEVPIIAAVK